MTECRSCGRTLTDVFADLGSCPLANAYVRPDRLAEPERMFPLTVYVCAGCFLVQVGHDAAPEALFSDYAYFSSYSDSWVAHARRYVDMIVPRLGLGPTAWIVEIASNDGYLLQHFVTRGHEVLGIEPAANVAEAASAKGVPTLVRFFGVETARGLVAGGRRADLIVANNVLAHVPDLDGFVAGLRLLLAPEGTITIEVPHLLRLIEKSEFDTIYHEHFSYFSLLSARAALARHGLRVHAAEELATHGGSVRLYVCHDGSHRPDDPSVAALLEEERAAGLDRIDTYRRFQGQVDSVRQKLVAFLHAKREEGRTVVAYGAPAKGNTLLNYCRIRTDLLPYTVDRSTHKQGTFLPGTRIPVHAPDRIFADRPDYVLILPWNIKEEIMEQMAAVRTWGGRFVVPIPEPMVID